MSPTGNKGKGLRSAPPEGAAEMDLNEALLNVEDAARDVDALFGGQAPHWRFNGRRIDGKDADALLILHDCLNDVDRERVA